MEPVLTDLSEPALAAAAKANLRRVFRHLAACSQARTETGDGWLRWRTDIAHPWFSGLLVDHAPPEPLLQDTIAALAEVAPLWSLWLADETPSTPWRDALAAAGLHRDEGIPEMAAALDDLPWDAPLPPGVTVETVADPRALRLWTETMVAGFGMPDDLVPAFAAVCAEFGWEPPFRYVLARLDGAPVATAGVIEAAGVAGVYYVATLPEARGRGIGGAVTREAVRASRDAGYRAAILQASPMGQPVYRRLGFRTVGAAVHYAFPLAPPQP